MEGLGFFWFMGIVIGLFISYILAKKYAEIAEMKGHDGSSYFWWCFWLGIFGHLLVVALPDRNKPEIKIEQPRPVVEEKDELPDL